MEKFEKLFPVQVQTLETLKKHPGCDLLVAAPTGSGKTLAYLFPIVNALKERIVPRIRALVVVPTSDLALQVAKVAASLRSSLSIVALCGAHSISHERSILVKGSADVIVATPGRLLDHLKHPEYFELQHLRFLVIDEADRLLNQTYYNWLDKLFDSLDSPSKTLIPSTSFSRDANGLPVVNVVTARERSFNSQIKIPTKLQKLVFSATLTQNPQKLTSLRLINPQTIHITSTEDSEQKYSIPETLDESLYICYSNKLALFVHLLGLLELDQGSILVFTKSISSAHRLAEFLNIYFDDKNIACAISSDIKQSKRKAILAEFESKSRKILVASDLYSRGMDFGHIKTVINYDVPSRVKAYVHRVGRTARANMAGSAITLLVRKQVKYFKDHVLAKCGRSKNVKRTDVKDEQLELVTSRCNEALLVLRDRVKGSDEFNENDDILDLIKGEDDPGNEEEQGDEAEDEEAMIHSESSSSDSSSSSSSSSEEEGDSEMEVDH